MQRGIAAVGMMLIAGLAPWTGVARADDDGPMPEAPTATMRSVFQEIKELVPLSLDPDRWSAPEARERILASLDRLERAAATLEEHGRPREPGFEELALNLGRDLREARERFRLGREEEARFFFTGSLQSCVACHVRLPSERSFPLATELTERTELDALDPRERAWLLVTVRRFDEALTVWEGLMGDPKLSASQLDASGVLVDYLNVAIRVRGQVDRVEKTLEAFAKRDDLPLYLRRRVREWSAAAAALDADRLGPEASPSLERGIELAREAGEVADGPYGRDGLVQDLAAASHLVRWLERDRARQASETRNRSKKERRDAARGYFWLGVVEARSLDGFWVDLSERHLEAAIRVDPKGPLAERAYALLEETEVLGYGGSSGVHLPVDVWNRLRELRELMGLPDPPEPE